MSRLRLPFLLLLLALLVVARPAPSRASSTPPPAGDVLRRDPRLDKLVKDITAKLCSQFRRHTTGNVSATIIDLGYVNQPLATPSFGSWRGDAAIYPASVVKIFYMGAAYVWQREGRLRITAPVYRDLQDMIGPSSNVATQHIVADLSGIDSGPALAGASLKVFSQRREAVNRWLRSLGLASTNADQATWDENYSPRDLQLVTGNLDGTGPHIHQNSSTSNDVAHFLLMIARNEIGTAQDCEAMRTLMNRQVASRYRPGYRVIFMDALPVGTICWGKSGFTSETSHDSAIITTADGRRFILAVMTNTYWDTTPFLGEFAVSAMNGLKAIQPAAQPKKIADEQR